MANVTLPRIHIDFEIPLDKVRLPSLPKMDFWNDRKLPAKEREKSKAAPVKLLPMSHIAHAMHQLGQTRTARFVREYAGRVYRAGELSVELARTQSPEKIRRMREEQQQLMKRCAALRKRILALNPGARADLDRMASDAKSHGAARMRIAGKVFTPEQMKTQNLRASGMIELSRRIVLGAKDAPSHLPVRCNDMDIPRKKAQVQALIDEHYRGFDGKVRMTAMDILRPCMVTGFPVDAMLALAKIESGYGSKGRGRRYLNPCNFGNDDRGNNCAFPSFEAGVYATIRKMERLGYSSRFSTAEDLIAAEFRRYDAKFYCPPQKEGYARKTFANALGVVRRACA